MADMKTGVFAKNVQKRLNRAQEKVLQKLGKADETKDEQFEEFVQNFKKQEMEGSRLQREMKTYLTAVKGLQQASMNLTQSLHEVYEPEWYGMDDVMSIGKDCDALWEDFHQKLVDSSLITLDTYLAQFPDIKIRIAKRSRKLIDYDSARHHLETLQAANIKNDRKISKAEEEFNKAQKVFEELNIDLQEELPCLWDSRVGFYVNTFKNVTNLETKFHKEISALCHKLYEVMTKLGEQHADKAFTIQGAPSDTGPLRLTRTPSPPDDESPPGSPTTSPNHMLAVLSAGPPRPKSPLQLKKGPPVPPPPKLTPARELAQEQIINLFDDNFVPECPVSVPTQDEKASESLLDLDFDPFKPDTNSVVGQSQTSMSQILPWDLWTASTGPTENVSSDVFNGFSQVEMGSSVFATDPLQSCFTQEGHPADAEMPFSPCNHKPVSEAAPPGDEMVVLAEPVPKPSQVQESPDTTSSVVKTNPDVEKAADFAEGGVTEPTCLQSDGPEETTSAEEREGSPTDTAIVAPEVEDESINDINEGSVAKEEKMPIPSVVIEPASSNEGDDDRDIDLTSPTDISDSVMTPDSQPSKDAPESTETFSKSNGIQGLPTGFLYKVETLHDFEAANTDELDIKRGDVVLVISTETVDQDAGWLTGIKESEWIQKGDAACRGLFPQSFTQRLE